MKKKGLLLALSLWLLAGMATIAAAHCEIPCGIYDDKTRITLMLEDIATIEKSMNSIIQLQAEKSINYNQLVRWIDNKEAHAAKLQDIVWQYFMTQRIKTDTPNYERKIGLLHQMLIYGMNCKQTTDLENVNKLRALVKEFDALYFEAKK
jgi:nickel superoxide dismutase